MKQKDSLQSIAHELDLPWQVEDHAGYGTKNSEILSHGRIVVYDKISPSAARFIVEAVNRAAGGYGRLPKPKFKVGDAVRVLSPIEDADICFGRWMRPALEHWVGQRAIVTDVCGDTYCIYLASEGPKTNIGWWQERRLAPIGVK